MSELPKGWVKTKIGDVTTVVAGGTPKAGDKSNFAEPGKGIAWLTPADLSKYGKKSISHGSRDLSPQGLKSSSAKLMPKGTILFSSRAPIGYTVIAENKIATNQGFKNFVLPKGLNSSYTYYYLKSIKHIAESMGTGTTFKELSGAVAKTLPFILAPTNEQIRIADKLDSMLAKVDAAQARLDKIPNILKRFRQSVLAAATSGELTKEWRDNTTNEIVTKKDVMAAHKKGWKVEKEAEFSVRGKRPKNEDWKKKCPIPYEPTKEDNELFKSFPANWQYVSVDQITRFVKDGPHYSPKYSESGVPFISGRNITTNGVDFKTCKYITQELHEELTKRCKPLFGDILYTKGGTTGIACVNDQEIDFNVWVHVAVLRVSNEKIIKPEYLKLVLNSPVCYERSQYYTHGVANRDLGLKRMIKICFPLPSPAEQNEIVRRVEELFAHADTVEKQYKDAKARTNRLTQSILAKAFRGELIPQVPNDESAVALLARIKADLDNVITKPKVKRKTKAA